MIRDEKGVVTTLTHNRLHSQNSTATKNTNYNEFLMKNMRRDLKPKKKKHGYSMSKPSKIDSWNFWTFNYSFKFEFSIVIKDFLFRCSYVLILIVIHLVVVHWNIIITCHIVCLCSRSSSLFYQLWTIRGSLYFLLIVFREQMIWLPTINHFLRCHFKLTIIFRIMDYFP